MSVKLDLLFFLFLTYLAACHWIMSRRCVSVLRGVTAGLFGGGRGDV